MIFLKGSTITNNFLLYILQQVLAQIIKNAYFNQIWASLVAEFKELDFLEISN